MPHTQSKQKLLNKMSLLGERGCNAIYPYWRIVGSSKYRTLPDNARSKA
jgi:hypothetical protein